jgi:hypothetical protein
MKYFNLIGNASGWTDKHVEIGLICPMREEKTKTERQIIKRFIVTFCFLEFLK